MDLKRSVAAIACLGVLAGCDSGVQGDRIVAQAGDHDFTVQDVVDLLAGAEFPNEGDVIDALANFWVDYTLVAIAAQEDSDLRNVDLEPVLRPQFEQEIIQLYRQASVQVDTVIDDASLRAIWDESPLEGRVSARHILMGLPDQATDEQRDSVFNVMSALKRRIEGGASFVALASEFSQDTGTRAQGGDLGWFERGQMVQPFEQAAFAMQPGELSDIVQTPFGFHLLRVDERETPSFESAKDQVRAQAVAERLRAADSTFLASVEEDGEVTVHDGSVAVLRELGAEPWQPLNRRAANRELAGYAGGSMTARDVQLFIQTRAPGFLGQIQQANDGQLEDLLFALARDRMLVRRASESGIEIDSARRDSLTEVTRDQLVEAADLLGLREIAPVEGESPAAALDRTIHGIIRAVLDGTVNVIPLGVVTASLRVEHDGQVMATGILNALERLEEVRGIPGAIPLPLPTDTTGQQAATPPVDSAG